MSLEKIYSHILKAKRRKNKFPVAVYGNATVSLYKIFIPVNENSALWNLITDSNIVVKTHIK